VETMKIVFDVEKRDETTGKTYYPGTEYEMSEEKAAKILAQTKYAHISKYKTTITKEKLDEAFDEIEKNKSKSKKSKQ
jgi:hypothetical protein